MCNRLQRRVKRYAEKRRWSIVDEKSFVAKDYVSGIDFGAGPSRTVCAQYDRDENGELVFVGYADLSSKGGNL